MLSRIAVLAASLVTIAALAGTATTPNTFGANTLAVAALVDTGSSATPWLESAGGPPRTPAFTPHLPFGVAAAAEGDLNDLPSRLSARVSAVTTKAGSVWPVSSCADSGAGSLRAVVANASTGDTVYFGGLTCGSITLQTPLIVAQMDLRIWGKGRYGDGIKGRIVHQGAGTLTLDRLVLSDGQMHGNWPGPFRGGCVESGGDVLVQDSVIRDCAVEHTGTAVDDAAIGGAIYSKGVTAVVRSDLALNSVKAAAGWAVGGAVMADGEVLVQDSLISSNEARGPQGVGGAIYAADVAIATSRIISNRADYGAGGVWAVACNVFSSVLASNVGGYSGALWCNTMQLVASTVSANRSNTGGDSKGGAVTAGSVAVISNSTISGNVEINFDDIPTGAGFTMRRWDPADLQIFSTVISGNVLERRVDQVKVPSDARVMLPATLVRGSHNLIGWAQPDSWVPADTIRANDPGLAPLGDNGGPTKTMAILPGSALIDRGANPLHMRYDQRRAGYARQFGPRPDIGAFELGGEEGLFADRFEAEPDITLITSP